MSDALIGVLIGGGIGFAGSYVVARVTNRGENERVDRQLKHERTMREREELRTLIDEAIQTVQDGIYRAREMHGALAHASVDLEDAEQTFGPADADLTWLRRRLNGYQSQLAIRLGVGNELADAVKECRVRLGTFQMIAPGPHSVPSGEDLKEVAAVLDEAADLAGHFEAKAVTYAGSQLRTDEPSP